MRTSTKAVIVAMATAFVLVLSASLTPALAAFTASINNTTNTFGSGSSALTATNGTVQCTSAGTAVTAATSFPCSGSNFVPVPATGTGTDTTTLAETGTLNFSSASYRMTSCGVVSLANTVDVADPQIPRFGVTYNNAGPFTGSAAVGFDGATTMSSDIAATTAVAAPQTFSISMWFRSTGTDGPLIEWTTSTNNTVGTAYDRHIYFTAAGNLAYGSYNGAVQIITSPNIYDDGNWHHVAVTSRASVTATTSRIILYVDGAAVANKTITSANPAEASAGNWRLGNGSSNVGGWTSGSKFYNGLISNTSIFNTELTAAQITTLYAARTSQTAWDAAVTARAPVENWRLNDTGMTTYSGSLPTIGTTSPCTYVRTTISSNTACVYPSTTTCPALSSTYRLSTLVTAGTLVLAPSTLATTQTLTTNVQRDTSYNTAYSIGLNLAIPTIVTEVGFKTNTYEWTNSRVII